MFLLGSMVAYGKDGGGPWGCLDCNSCHVISLLGAMPEEVRTWQALVKGLPWQERWPD